jgi:8-amino-7-oxononanoate synthase
VEVKGDADGPIQAIMTPGAELCVRMAEWIREGGFEVRAIRKPTVKEGGERRRVVVHSYNTKEEIDGLKRR